MDIKKLSLNARKILRDILTGGKAELYTMTMGTFDPKFGYDGDFGSETCYSYFTNIPTLHIEMGCKRDLKRGEDPIGERKPGVISKLALTFYKFSERNWVINWVS